MNLYNNMEKIVRMNRRRFPRIDDDTIQDIKSDVIIEWLENPQTVDNTEAYLTRMFANQCIDYIRMEQNRSRLKDDNSDQIIENLTPTLSSKRTADDPFDQLQGMEGFRERYQSMSPRLRHIGRLTYGDGCSVGETAKVLDCSKAAVYKAMQRIKQILEETNNE